MRRFLAGVVVGMMLCAPSVFALRAEKPTEFTEWNSNTFSKLNQILLQFFNVQNGRYAMDVVTVDPDGSRRGGVGEMVFFDTATDRLCVNSDGAKAWKCVDIT